MPFDRSQICRGMQLTGGDYPAHVGRLGALAAFAPDRLWRGAGAAGAVHEEPRAFARRDCLAPAGGAGRSRRRPRLPQVAAAVTISAALRMRLELARLRDRHGIAPEPVDIPLSMPSDGP